MKFLWLLLAFSLACAEDIPNFAQVAPGLFRGGQPTAQGFTNLLAYGVSNIVVLNCSKDRPALAMGMRVNRFPIGLARQTILEPKSRALSGAVWAITPGTYVHCQHGQDRTGLVIACYRVSRDHWDKARAEQEMLAHHFHKSLFGLWRAWKEYGCQKPTGFIPEHL